MQALFEADSIRRISHVRYHTASLTKGVGEEGKREGAPFLVILPFPGGTKLVVIRCTNRKLKQRRF